MIPPFSSDPDSKLKQSALILWQFAHLHGLNMDGCGKECANQAIKNVEFIYAQKETVTTDPEPIVESEFKPLKHVAGIKLPPARADIDGEEVY